MRVYVVRHGETDWNRDGRYQGQCESHLTRTGTLQAVAVADALAPLGVRRVIASPLIRCRDTAAPLAERLAVPVQIDERLIEIAHGVWEGRPRDELAREDAARFRDWRDHPERVHFPQGESLGEVLARWRTFAEALGGNDDVAVFTHDVLVRLAILDATGRPISRLWEPRVVNGGYASFEVSGGRWALADACADEHLGALLIDPAHQAL